MTMCTVVGWESGDSAEFASGSSPDFSNQSPQESVSPKYVLLIIIIIIIIVVIIIIGVHWL